MRQLYTTGFVLIFIAMATLVHPVLGQAETSDESPYNHYAIDAKLDYESGVLTAHEVIGFKNRTVDPLDNIVFDVTPAKYESFTLNQATVDGRPVTGKLEGVTLELALPQPLKPAANANIALDFRVVVPKKGGRLGVGGGIMALGNWYPVLAVYRDGPLTFDGREKGWDRHRYVETGDAFFSEVADYDVDLALSSPATVVHTGTLVKRDGNHWTMKARGVRDFALVVSADFESSNTVADGVAIEAYYLPAHSHIAETYLDAAKQALVWLDKVVAPYPFTRLSVAEVFSTSNTAVGQEYPNLVMISSAINEQGGPIDSYLAYLVIHEVAHQWFYAMVGNDQIYAPWLDEAMVSWLTLHFYRANYPDLFPGLWNRRLTQLMNALPAAERAKPVNTGIYDYADESIYYGVVYRKGAQFLEELYQKMGDESFFAALRSYFETFRGGVATPEAFLDSFQAGTKENLHPLYQRYFTYGRYRSSEPLRLTVELPATKQWSGMTTATFSATTTLKDFAVYVDYHPLASTGERGKLTFDTGSLSNGEHRFTFVAVDAEGRGAQIDRTAMVANVGLAPTTEPSPSAAPAVGITPKPEPTPTVFVPESSSEPEPTAAPPVSSISVLGLYVELSNQALAWFAGVFGVVGIVVVWRRTRPPKRWRRE